MFNRIKAYLCTLVNSGTVDAMEFYEEQWKKSERAYAETMVQLLALKYQLAKEAWEAADAVGTLASMPEDEKLNEAYHWAKSDLEDSRYYLELLSK